MERRNQWRPSTRLLVLLVLMGVGFVAASVVTALLLPAWGLLPILTVQDVLVFIAPAIAAMALFYRRPLREMGLCRMPGARALLIVVFFYIVSLPAMNWLVAMNNAMTLPSWLSGIEQAMRAMEDSAAQATQQLLDIHTAWQLAGCVLVVGVMAGLSEEMFFRGAMQRTLQDSRMSAHAAVWVAAIIFSAIHLQFFGFVPRMVLGVWFGYLLLWTRSLWVPIIAHILNNSTVVVMSYLGGKGIVAQDLGETLGLPSPGAFPWLAVASLTASIALALLASRHLPGERQQ